MTVAAWAVAAAIVVPGCFRGPESDQTPPSTSGAASSAAAATPAATKDAASRAPSAARESARAKEPPESGLVPFKPPSLAELDAKAEWVSQPVRSALELLDAQQAQETPLCSVAEALSLRNTSDENNRKILSALGRGPAKSADVDWNATIRRHSRVELKSTNPVMMSSVVEMEIGALTSLTLFEFDRAFNTFGSKDLLVSWQSSKDHLTDKLVLRDDLTWSDGHPLTAHDVVFSFQTILNPKIPIPAVRSGTDELRWVEAYDDRTVVFFHKEALATNFQNMGFPIIPKHIYEKSIADDFTMQQSPYHVKYEIKPVTAGPYVIAERRQSDEIVLERREGYYLHNGKQVRPKPYFKTIRFRVLPDANTSLLALKRGDIDEMLLLPPSIWLTQTVDDDFYRLNTKAKAVEWTEFHFTWNCASPFFSDKRVRKAMSYAFDYPELINNLLSGLAQQSVGPYYPTSWMAPHPSPAPFKQDFEKAEALLKEAGWEDHDGDGVRDKIIDGRKVKFEFSMLTINAPDRVNICALMKDNLDQLGIKCDVRPLEFTVLQDKMLKHEFQAAFSGWGTGTDPDTTENLFATKAIKQGRNFGEYSNPAVDALFEQGKREFDRDKRAKIYAKIDLLLWDDQPYTWLYWRNAFYAFNKELRGYVFSPRGPYIYSPGFFHIWRVAH